MKRKIFTLCTALILGASTLFASDTAVDGIYYNFNSTNLTASVTYRGSNPDPYTNEYTGDVVIPATVTYDGKTYSVTRITYYAFYGCSGLTSVTIPNSVTSIGNSAFEGCRGLTSVTIPNSVTSIEDDAFYGCVGLPVVGNLRYADTFLVAAVDKTQSAYTIKEGTKWIGKDAFRDCSGLTSVTIPNSVTSIGYSAFSGCSSLTSVMIPNSVTSIGGKAFAECSGLTSVTIGNSVKSIGYSAFESCSGLTSITIPNSVTSIGEYAFSDCSSLTSVVWNAKNCVYSFEDSKYPFYGIASQITSFTFGDEVEYIPAYLCYGMNNLTSVTIPNSVTSIGKSAFWGCSGLTKTYYTGNIAGWCGITFHYDYDISIFGGGGSNPTEYSHNLYINNVEVKEDLVIPNGVTSIGDGAFYDFRGLTSITIPNSVTSIGDGAFYDCSGLTSVTIGNSVESIENYTFYGCSGLTSVTIPNSVTSIGYSAFSGCSSLTSVMIPNSVTNIGSYAFSCSGLTSVTIPNSVTSIGRSAFAGCSGLTSVTIGNSVESIGVRAFENCTKLINIVCYAAEPPSCDASAFANYNVFLKVPCNNLMAYQTHAVWGSFKYISCIGSEEVQVTEFSVTPSTNDVQFTWPAEPNAVTYELVISKDGVVFCTLTFNANGQLMGIAFAPSANAPAAAPTTSGFQFTVTGLDEASHYTYTFDAKDAGGNVIKHYAGEFNTEGSTVGLEQIELANIYTQDGRIVCEGEFRIYDLLGRDVTRLNGSLCGVYVVKSGNAAVKVVVK